MAGQMKNQILKSEKSITLKLLRLHISRWQLAQVGSPTSPPPPPQLRNKCFAHTMQTIRSHVNVLSLSKTSNACSFPYEKFGCA